jgi:hypothetical protein
MSDEPLLFFDHLGAEEKEGEVKVRLVSLKSWEFECDPAGLDFVGLLEHLNLRKLEYEKREAIPKNGPEDSHINKIPSAAYHLPVPEAPSEPANSYAKLAYRHLRSGYVPLPHFLRRGAKTISWYRGPLVPLGQAPANLYLPARGPDELLIFNSATGMFDVSYAAAWELGRLLALQDTSFALKLLHWKRAHALSIAHEQKRIDHDFLPLAQNRPTAGALPQDLSDWFADLTNLKKVPFNYLVPQEALLPPEALRFFQVDPMWLECLRDGAFSAGRVLTKDHLEDHTHREQLAELPHISGFLLRSAVVAGWPGLIVDGYVYPEGAPPDDWETDSHLEEVAGFEKLPLLRLDRLAPNLLIGLFYHQTCDVQFVDFHLQPETLHFGLEPGPAEAGKWLKKLRDPKTGDQLALYVEDTDHPDGQIKLTQSSLAELAQADKHGGAQLSPEILTKLEQAVAKAPNQEVVLKKEEKESLQDTLKIWLAQELGTLDQKQQDLIWKHTYKFVLEQIETTEMWKYDDPTTGVLEFARLFELAAAPPERLTRGQKVSAADFGLQMLDAAPLVRFWINNVQPEER